MERHLQGDKNVCARTVGNAILIPDGPSSLPRRKHIMYGNHSSGA